MASSKSNYIIKHPSQRHTHTIIFLHGRDSTASEFSSELFESQASSFLTLPQIFPSVKWVFPSSKQRMSARFEQELSQWFDMWSVETPSEREEIQKEGLRDSVLEILQIVSEEVRVVRAERVVLAGISQGCATAVWALLCRGVWLGGLVGFCGWLPFQEDVKRIMEDGRKEEMIDGAQSKSLTDGGWKLTPVFLSHSRDDQVVPVENGRALCESLKNVVGLKVTWKEYEKSGTDDGHWINEPQGIDDLVAFLRDKVNIAEADLK